MFNFDISELDTTEIHTHIEGDDIDTNNDTDNISDSDLYDTPEELPNSTLQYFKDRAKEYDIEVQDLIDKIPNRLKNDPLTMHVYLMHKHISHHIPLSQGGHPSDPENWDLEDESKNLSRGAAVKTNAEIEANRLDAQADAERLREYIRTKSVPADVLINGDEMGKAYISYTKLVSKSNNTGTVINAVLRLLSL